MLIRTQPINLSYSFHFLAFKSVLVRADEGEREIVPGYGTGENAYGDELVELHAGGTRSRGETSGRNPGPGVRRPRGARAARTPPRRTAGATWARPLHRMVATG